VQNKNRNISEYSEMRCTEGGHGGFRITLKCKMSLKKVFCAEYVKCNSTFYHFIASITQRVAAMEITPESVQPEKLLLGVCYMPSPYRPP
jgi:hypothetical protein